MAEEIKKHCGTCKYDYLGPGYEPCKSCSDSCDSWVSKEATDEEAQKKTCKNCKPDHLYSSELPCAHCMNDEYWEPKEPEKYMYFVAFYCVDDHDNVVMNNCFIERDEKLRTMEDIKGIREDIKNECCSGNVVIINWKELEG